MARRKQRSGVSGKRLAALVFLAPVFVLVAAGGTRFGLWALEQAGFRAHGAGVQRADGTHTGFWFGVTHDAVIRIRPGRTDIRVAARDPLPHGGEACRLATRISEALRTGD